MYSLVWCLALALTWLTLRLEEDGRPLRAALWVLAGMAGLLTHYFFAFIWLACVVWLWMAGPQARRRILLLAGATVLAVLPWYVQVPASLARWRVSGDWLERRARLAERVDAAVHPGGRPARRRHRSRPVAVGRSRRPRHSSGGDRRTGSRRIDAGPVLPACSPALGLAPGRLRGPARVRSPAPDHDVGHPALRAGRPACGPAPRCARAEPAAAPNARRPSGPAAAGLAAGDMEGGDRPGAAAGAAVPGARGPTRGLGAPRGRRAGPLDPFGRSRPDPLPEERHPGRGLGDAAGHPPRPCGPRAHPAGPAPGGAGSRFTRSARRTRSSRGSGRTPG